MLKVSVWTLQADPDSDPESSLWKMEHEANFADIWADSSYKIPGMQNAEPIMAPIHPDNPRIVYFILNDHKFGVDVPIHSIVGCKLYNPVVPSKDLVSSRFPLAWLERPSSGDAAFGAIILCQLIVSACSLTGYMSIEQFVALLFCSDTLG
jgi:hypothetical protein